MTDNVKSKRKVMQDGNRAKCKSLENYIYNRIWDQSLVYVDFESDFDPDVRTARV